MRSIAHWLDGLGLGQYSKAFAENDIDLELVRSLSEQDLECLGVTSMGHRKKLLTAIAALDAPAPAVTASQPQRPPERRQLTVMFCDLVGSTALSTAIDPEVLREVVRAYQATCAARIAHFEGHIAQYLGDGLLVYFGHPLAHEDDAARAVRAGLEILRALQELNQTLQTNHGVSIAVRIGIHTGLVVLGAMGGGERQETLALGETPILAARLQGIAEPGSILISGVTYKLVEGLFETRSQGTQPLKGLAEPVEALQVLAARAARDRVEARSRLSALVGRDHEIGLLIDCWERVLEGRGQVALLMGEPGIGKSRMVLALDKAIEATPHQRVEWRCSPLYTQSPLYPLVDRLPQRFGWEPGDTHEVEMEKLRATLTRYDIALEESLPLMALLLARAPPASHPVPPMSPQRQRRRTLETLVALMAAMAAEVPVLLVVEDLHWADPTTLELIGQYIEQAPTTRLFVVLSARPGFVPPWGARSYLTPLLLNRLTLKQTHALALQFTRGKALPDEVLRQIASKTDGVPLFVEELTKSVLESKFLREAADCYELTGPLPPLAIPSTLHDILMSRLDRLSRGREMVQLAATLGRSFSFELISAVASRDDDVLRGDLDELVRAELLFQKGFGAQANYVFKHALIQDAAYQSLLKSARQQIHRTIAQTLVSRFETEANQRPEYVAHHYTEAGMLIEGGEYWKHAGDRSARASAFAEALAHYQKGVQTIAQLPASRARAEMELALQLGSGMVIAPLRGYTVSEIERVYLRASHIAEEIDDKPRLVEALWGLSLYHWVGRSIDKGREIAEKSLRIAEQAKDLDSILAARHSLACTAMAKGDLIEAQKQFEAMLAEYGEAPRPSIDARFSTELRLNALHFFSLTLWILGYPEKALRCYQELFGRCASTAQPYNQIWRSIAIGQLSPWIGDCIQYEKQLAADQALCMEQDLMFIATVIATFRNAILAHGDPASNGIAVMRQLCIQQFRSFDSEFSLPLFMVLLAGAQLAAGDWDGSLQSAQQGLDVSSRNGEFRTDAELHRIIGECRLHGAGRDELAAEQEFREALRIARDQQARSFELRAACSMARLWQSQGRRREARELLVPVYLWFTEGFDTRDLKEARLLLETLGS